MASQDSLFKRALFASIFFHIVLWTGFYFRNAFFREMTAPTIEIDLTKPFRIGGNPLLKPGGGTTLETPKRIGPPPKGEPVSEAESKPKEWVLPGPNTRELEKPKAELPPKGAHPEGLEDGYGEGYQGRGGPYGGGEGEGGGMPLTRMPALLNRSEIMRMLRKLYPRIEREVGREGQVIVDLHIGSDGLVSSVEIAGSGGNSFDSVAQIVAKKMRFSPAMVQTTPVAVKIRQPIEFKLED